MRLSAPIFRLKRDAKTLAREVGIPLHEALNRVAADEGFKSWSLLAAKAATAPPSRDVLARLNPGELILLGGRPGHGKTIMGLELIVEAIQSGQHGVFFTLEYTDRDVLKHLEAIGGDKAVSGDRFMFDASDDISADYIIDRLGSSPRETVVVIDYLQLLDQKRTNPDLMTQVRALKAFAAERCLIIVFLSQIDRSYDPSTRLIPGVEDIRLPNPLDVTLFDKTCFLHNGEVRIEAVR